MIMDKELVFSDKQAVTASGTSTNVVDLGSADAGNSDHIELFVKVDAAFNNLTSLGVKLQTSVDAAFTSPVDTPVNSTILLAGLTANTQVVKAKVPYGMYRYARVYYTVTGTAPTTGTVTAALVADMQTNVSF
jgi:hypothetical protein